MIRNIVFDMGDVLLDYRPMTTCLRLAENPQEARLLCEAVFRIPQWEREYDQGAISEEDMLSQIQAPLPTQGLKDRAARVFSEFHLDALTPHPGMEALLHRLLDRGFSLYLLSNTSQRFHRFRHLTVHRRCSSSLLGRKSERADPVKGVLAKKIQKLLKL